MTGTPTTSLEKVQPLVARFLGIDSDEMHRHFQPASPRHLERIVRIRQDVIAQSPERDRTYLQWRYHFDSTAQGKVLDENRIWVFSKDDDILGLVGVEAIDLLVDGETVPALKVMDLAVKPEVDRKGLGVWMNLHLQRMGRPIIALGSNRNSLGIMSKLFHRMPNHKVYKNLLNSSHYFEHKIQNRLLAPLLSSVYDAIVPLILNGKSRRVDSPFEVRRISRFSEMEGRTLAAMQDTGICFKRDADYLNWRLLDNPLEDVEVIGLWDSGQLVAYLAVAFRRHSSGRDQVVILDWGRLPGEHCAKSLAALLLAHQLLWRKQGYESVIAFGYDESTDRLMKAGGLRLRDDDTKTFSIFAPDQRMFNALSRSDRWFLNGSDTDYA